MRDLWPVIGSNLRRRWVSTTVLAVLVGIALGVTTAAAVGARRTATAFPRFTAEQVAPDLILYVGETGGALADAIRERPQVDAAGAGTGVGLLLRNPDGSPDFDRDAFGALVSDGVAGYDVDHPLILAGRLPDPVSAHELLLDENAAATTGAQVGDVIPALTFNVGVIMEISAEFEESGREPTQADFDEVFTPVDMEVVGIGRTSAAVLTNEAVVGEPTALLSPAFLDEHPETASYTVAMVELTDPASVGDYVTAVRDELPGVDVSPVDQASLQTSFAAAVRPYWLALAFFALVFGAGGLLALGPAVVRTVDEELVERSTLRALGATRRQMVTASLVRVVLVAAGATVVGSVLAVVASSRFPVGPARIAEPALGTELHVAGLVAAAASLFLAVGAAAAIRAAALTRRPVARTPRPSALVARASSMGLSAPAVTGLHAAFGDGARRRRRGAAPAGVAVALAVAIGALGFGSGLSRLVDDPVRFGWNWDVLFENYDAPLDDETAAELAEDPAVAGLVPITRGSITLDGAPVPAVGMELGAEGAVAPVVLEGRPPATSGEIVVGAITARELGVGVGDRVTGDTAGGEPLPLEVVGISVIPSIALDSSTQLGRGAFLVRDDHEAMVGWFPTAALATLRPEATLAELEERYDQGVSPLGVQRPADVIAYDGIDEVPRILAGVLGLLTVAVLVHLLVGSVRRRRQELAVLRALGMRPRQVASSVVWQTNAFALAVIAVALPLGIVAGRRTWRWFADGIGVAGDPSTPLGLIGVTVVVVVVVANLAALIPARRASSIDAANALRAE